MARVPITVMGYRCERCGHEWVPRGNIDEEPKMCPACKSVRWNSERKIEMTYEAFSQAVSKVLQEAGGQLTWTEVRTGAKLPQAFPNNKWVRRMESDIGLRRKRDAHGIIHWSLGKESDLFGSSAKTAEAPIKKGERTRRKQGAVE